MNYKKFIRSRKVRQRILKCLAWVPDSLMVRLEYRIHTGRKLNLRHPKRYTEKLQHYKIYYRHPDMPRCVDKYEVRKYIEERGKAPLLNKLLGIYDNIADVDFSKLPERFVVKTTTGGGNTEVFICKENITENRKKILNLFSDMSAAPSTGILGREWAYKGIAKNRIIIEEYLEDPHNPEGGIDDFKFICTNGKVRYIVLDTNRNIDHRRNIYDLEWNDQHVVTDHVGTDFPVPKPENLDELIKTAEELASPFPHVRVDLYNINGKIYFGELTFYPWSGYLSFYPDEFDTKLGDLFEINY